MKRLITRILICLLLGVVLTVAVAWTCAVSVNAHDGRKRVAHVTNARRSIEVTRWDAFGSTRVSSTFSESDEGVAAQTSDPKALTPPYASELTRPTDEFADDAVSADTRWVEARGWPWRALSCRGGFYRHEDEGRQDRARQSAIELSMEPWVTPSGRLSTPRMLPLRPILPGALLNVLFYGALVYAGLFLPIDARRWMRRRRGRCTKCGHQLDEAQTACPACGRLSDQAADRSSLAQEDVFELLRSLPIRLSTILTLLWRAAICTLIGVVLTISVAVACSLLVNVYEREPRSETEVGVMNSDRATRYDAFGSMRIHAQHWRYRIGERKGGDAYERLFPDYARDTRLRNDNLWQLRRSERFIDGRGWPFRALVTEVDISRKDAEYVAGIAVSTWTQPGDTPRKVPRVIPLAPIWRGVLLNTAIYAVATYILLFVPIDLYRRSRRRRKKREPSASDT